MYIQNPQPPKAPRIPRTTRKKRPLSAGQRVGGLSGLGWGLPDWLPNPFQMVQQAIQTPLQIAAAARAAATPFSVALAPLLAMHPATLAVQSPLTQALISSPVGAAITAPLQMTGASVPGMSIPGMPGLMQPQQQQPAPQQPAPQASAPSEPTRYALPYQLDYSSLAAAISTLDNLRGSLNTAPDNVKPYIQKEIDNASIQINNLKAKEPTERPAMSAQGGEYTPSELTRYDSEGQAIPADTKVSVTLDAKKPEEKKPVNWAAVGVIATIVISTLKG